MSQEQSQKQQKGQILINFSKLYNKPVGYQVTEQKNPEHLEKIIELEENNQSSIQLTNQSNYNSNTLLFEINNENIKLKEENQRLLSQQRQNELYELYQNVVSNNFKLEEKINDLFKDIENNQKIIMSKDQRIKELQDQSNIQKSDEYKFQQAKIEILIVQNSKLEKEIIDKDIIVKFIFFFIFIFLQIDQQKLQIKECQQGKQEIQNKTISCKQQEQIEILLKQVEETYEIINSKSKEIQKLETNQTLHQEEIQKWKNIIQTIEQNFELQQEEWIRKIEKLQEENIINIGVIDVLKKEKDQYNQKFSEIIEKYQSQYDLSQKLSKQLSEQNSKEEDLKKTLNQALLNNQQKETQLITQFQFQIDSLKKENSQLQNQIEQIQKIKDIRVSQITNEQERIKQMKQQIKLNLKGQFQEQYEGHIKELKIRLKKQEEMFDTKLHEQQNFYQNKTQQIQLESEGYIQELKKEIERLKYLTQVPSEDKSNTIQKKDDRHYSTPKIQKLQIFSENKTSGYMAIESNYISNQYQTSKKQLKFTKEECDPINKENLSDEYSIRTNKDLNEQILKRCRQIVGIDK